MIRWEVSNFSSFSECLEICPECSIPLTKSVTPLSRHPIYSLFFPLGVMLRLSITLHLLVVFDDITGQLINCNDNYKFSVCPYSVLQEFVVDSEMIVTSYSEIVRKLHAW